MQKITFVISLTKKVATMDHNKKKFGIINVLYSLKATI